MYFPSLPLFLRAKHEARVSERASPEEVRCASGNNFGRERGRGRGDCSRRSACLPDDGRKRVSHVLLTWRPFLSGERWGERTSERASERCPTYFLPQTKESWPRGGQAGTQTTGKIAPRHQQNSEMPPRRCRELSPIGYHGRGLM